MLGRGFTGGAIIYTAEEVAWIMANYGIRITKGTVVKYEEYKLIPSSDEGLYPPETPEELYASYWLLHHGGPAHKTYGQVFSARSIALQGRANNEVKRYKAPKEWLAYREYFRKAQKQINRE